MLKPVSPDCLFKTAPVASKPLGAVHGWPISGLLEQNWNSMDPTVVGVVKSNEKLYITLVSEGTADDIINLLFGRLEIKECAGAGKNSGAAP